MLREHNQGTKALEIAERAKKKATDKKPRTSPGHVILGSKPKPSALRNGTLAGAKKIDLKCFLIKKKHEVPSQKL